MCLQEITYAVRLTMTKDNQLLVKHYVSKLLINTERIGPSMRKILCGILLFTLVCVLTACGENHPVNKVELISDNYVIEHYTDKFPEYDNIQTEIYYVSWEGGLFTNIGPTEPGYRAVISLNNNAKESVDEYDWEPTEAPQFTAELVNIPEGQEWYECKQFEEDKFKFVNVNYLYFNGTDTIVFDIHTY